MDEVVSNNEDQQLQQSNEQQHHSFIDLHPTLSPPVKATELSSPTVEVVVCTVCLLKGCRRNPVTGSLSTCKEISDSCGGPHVQSSDN